MQATTTVRCRRLLHALRKLSRAISLIVLAFLVTGLFAIFCQQCFSMLDAEPAPQPAASCCPHSAELTAPAPAAGGACHDAPEIPCVMATALEPQSAQATADIKFNIGAKATVLALFLMLPWLLAPPGATPTTVLRTAAKPFYDPRRLERTRLLLI